MALHNRIEWIGSGVRMGIKVDSGNVDWAPGPVILRHNIIARECGSELGDAGIMVKKAKNAIVERNLIDVTFIDNSVRFDACTNRRTFSNRKKNSTLLPGYDVTQARHTEEWELETEKC